MGNKTFIRCWIGWMAIVLIGSCVAWGRAVEARPVRLLVVVFNEGHVDREIVERAEKHAEGVFRQAGVRVLWRNAGYGEPRTETDSSVRRLDVHILSRARTLGDEVFGMAFVGEGGGGQQADVFYDAIAKANLGHAQDRAVLLGAVMTHELGHLLLGSRAHTAAGIMRANWDDSALRLVAAGMAGFSSQQGMTMREKIEGFESAMARPEAGDREFGIIAGLR